MINYIIGIGVATLVVAIIVRGVRRKIRGEGGGCGCGSTWSSCSGCSTNSCGCNGSSSHCSHETEKKEKDYSCD